MQKSAQKKAQKKHLPKKMLLCTCLTDYRTLVDSLKDFALFIEWYELYHS